ncbi:SPASM domain-containing protein [Thermococcus sp. Bubb.Bath]|uniref:SPASM domain-containing protein n=1 Tax=Thermococcus sp. Bubb.Bath TaxID=1638242 RepID=UPI00143955E5|nr:SPASM domain-containing protein [Thermococcus sp. Bubb.Bath]
MRKPSGGIRALLSEGIKVSVAFTLILENRNNTEELYRFVDELGVSSFNVGWGVPLGRLKERVPYGEYLETVERLRRLGLDTPVFGGTLGDPLPVKPDSLYSCEAGTSQVFISSTGDVYPCLILRHPSFRMGSVREESLIEIWRKKEWEKLKRNLTGTRCESCPLFPRCRGGCPGEALLFRGSINEPAPNCRLEAGWTS